jgi:transcriptional regulator GlxA family with amidase domain
MHGLLQALAAANMLDPALNVGVEALSQELVRHAKVWRALERLYGRHETSPYLDFISELTGRSLRQLDRDFRALCDTFGLHGNNFRATLRVLRLRRAVLLLSAPTATPKQVATEVGYGSVEALDRAFRDAGLPAPGTVRAELLAGVPAAS